MSNSNAEIRARYVELRGIQRALNTKLLKTLSPKAMRESARRLGILVNNTIVFDSDDDVHVLQNAAIYDYFPNGEKNAVERYAAHQTDLSADERVILDAMCRSRFTLVELGERVPEVGVEARDLLFGYTFLLADLGLSTTAPAGIILATRMYTLDGFEMTSGAAQVFDAGLRPLIEGPFVASLAARGPVERWSSRERSALGRLLLEMAVLEREEARFRLASYVIAALPEGHPFRKAHARLQGLRKDARA